MDDVIYNKIENVAVATLNRPDKFNCISSGLLASLGVSLDRAEADSQVRMLLVKANGPHFCTGADLDEVQSKSADRNTLAEFMKGGHLVMRRLENSHLPVVAAVHGYCLAGGLELAMCADIVLLRADARMGCQHARYGLVPGWGGTQRLPRLVGLRRALELMYSARWLQPEEAIEWGLANHVLGSDDFEGEALAYVAKLARGNPEGLAAMKRLAREGLEHNLDDGLRLEQDTAVPVLQSDNVAEGLAAFQERREPRFK